MIKVRSCVFFLLLLWRPCDQIQRLFSYLLVVISIWPSRFSTVVDCWWAHDAKMAHHNVTKTRKRNIFEMIIQRLLLIVECFWYTQKETWTMSSTVRVTTSFEDLSTKRFFNLCFLKTCIVSVKLLTDLNEALHVSNRARLRCTLYQWSRLENRKGCDRGANLNGGRGHYKGRSFL